MFKNFSFLILFLTVNFCLAQRTETFTYSKNFIKPGKYKLSIIQKDSEDFSTVYFSVFKKAGSKWQKIQTVSFKKQAGFYLTADTAEDLNNDGYRDLKISFANAGRGSNSLEKLFIFNQKSDRLLEIKNSQEYPNLHYNPVRNCVVSYSFSGGNSTSFLKLNKNKLEEFARVDLYNDTVRSFRIKNGKEILLKKKFYKVDDAAIFFSDFNPIEE